MHARKASKKRSCALPGALRIRAACRVAHVESCVFLDCVLLWANQFRSAVRRVGAPNATDGILMPLQLGGSGVLVQPMTYIFDEEPARWRQLLDNLGLEEAPVGL